MRFSTHIVFGLCMLASACSAGTSETTGSGTSGGAPTVDLGTKSYLWIGNAGGKSLVLYTYKSASTLIDVRATPKAGTEAQYQGARTGSAATGYTFELDAVDASRTLPAWGLKKTLSCVVGTAKPELICGSTVFTQATAQDIAQ
jgi:hypothetical protein